MKKKNTPTASLQRGKTPRLAARHDDDDEIV